MKSNDEINEVKALLKQFYAREGNERCGFVCDGEIIEVKNSADNPTTGFFIGPEDVIKFTEEKNSWATWHTHPSQDANLSGSDHNMFLNWPELVHFIVGSDGVKCYQYDSNKKAVLAI